MKKSEFAVCFYNVRMKHEVYISKFNLFILILILSLVLKSSMNKIIQF